MKVLRRIVTLFERARPWVSGAILVLLVPSQICAQGVQSGESIFTHEQRSTLETITFHSIEEQALAEAVIEGGLVAPAAGVPVRADQEDDHYLDPLALQPRDNRTDLGRSEIPVDIRFSTPRMIPGQVNSNVYSIMPDSNRTYQAFDANVSGR